MNYHRRSIFSLFVILAFYFLGTTYAFCFFTEQYRVHVINGIPNNNIVVHCQSRDDDMGTHTLSTDGEFSWKFCQNTRQTTLYFCHFWWQGKQQVFDVFNKTTSSSGMCVYGKIYGTHQCKWLAKSDGFYWFKDHDNVWVKGNDWS